MHDPPDDYIVALRTVREIAVGAVLDDFIVPAADKDRIPRTFLTEIEGTVAEHAVEIFKTLMARKVLAIPIFKKAIGIFHLNFSPLSSPVYLRFLISDNPAPDCIQSSFS